MRARRAAQWVVVATLALLNASPGAGQTQGNLVGEYCLAGVREVGSCFRFNADQTFEYFLAYGAYDEASQGRWRLDGTDVVLESPPYDRKPRFVFKERRAADGNAFTILVVTAAGRGLVGVDVRLRCDGGAHEGYTQEDGFVTPCTSAPGEIALGLRMFGLAYEAVPVPGTPASQKTLVFEFEPGDLGKKAFTGTRLQRMDGGLSMVYRNPAMREHDGRTFSYRRN